jgi:predicted RNA-binding Zn ribbon-like protein
VLWICVRWGADVDPVSLIVAALAAGAVAGAQNTATDAVKDAYTGLKELVRRRLSGRESGQAALARHEADLPEEGAALEAELIEVKAADEASVVAAAQRLMALLDPTGSRAGKYTVDLRGAQGVQAGDHNVQTNTFGAPPTAP